VSMDVRDSQLGQRFATQCGTGPYRHRGRIRGLGVYSSAGARPTILLPFAGATTPLAFCPSSHYGASGNATSSLLRQGPGTPNPGSPPPSGM